MCVCVSDLPWWKCEQLSVWFSAHWSDEVRGWLTDSSDSAPCRPWWNIYTDSCISAVRGPACVWTYVSWRSFLQHLWISGGSLLILALCSMTSFATFPLIIDKKKEEKLSLESTHHHGNRRLRAHLYLKRLPLKKRLLLDTVRTWLDFSNLSLKTEKLKKKKNHQALFQIRVNMCRWAPPTWRKLDFQLHTSTDVYRPQVSVQSRSVWSSCPATFEWVFIGRPGTKKVIKTVKT